uniref:Uncharacterized protein n=1 Tax=Heterorhabditis bacteriophora TaxID=37862 RepID=A0A1I7WJ88_HETBA
MTESSGGWYNTRKQYRSVAYGTWKVGGARQITRKYSEDTRPVQYFYIYIYICSQILTIHLFMNMLLVLLKRFKNTCRPSVLLINRFREMFLKIIFINFN